MSRTKQDLLSGVINYKNAKFVGNNTLEIEYNNGSRAIRLHDTDVLIFKNDKIIVNTNGWLTVTSKDRINTFSDLQIVQRNNQWFINEHLYYDGIIFDSKGKLLSKEIKDRSIEIKKMKAKITKYVKLITKDNLPQPTSGDCWYCLLRNKDNKTMGDTFENKSHLLDHLKENYLHGSILVNAMKECGYRDDQIGFHYQLKVVDTFRRAVRRYLQKRLITNIAVN